MASSNRASSRPRGVGRHANVRGGDPARAGDVVSALFGPRGTRALSAAQRAAQAWYAANGDRERTHTTGVWLRKSGHAGVDPVLVVEVDSGLLAAELGTNKEIYLQRIAFRGVRVSDIRFSVGRRKTGPNGTAGMRAATAGNRGAKRGKAGDNALSAVRLTDEEEARIARAVAGLPDRLRTSAAAAMRASLKRNKAH